MIYLCSIKHETKRRFYYRRFRYVQQRFIDALKVSSTFSATLVIILPRVLLRLDFEYLFPNVSDLPIVRLNRIICISHTLITAHSCRSSKRISFYCFSFIIFLRANPLSQTNARFSLSGDIDTLDECASSPSSRREGRSNRGAAIIGAFRSQSTFLHGVRRAGRPPHCNYYL